MKYVYASRSGNVEELVHVLGLEAMKIKDGTETMDQDFILLPIRMAEALCRLL